MQVSRPIVVRAKPKFHRCAADGCGRVINAKFDFCFTCSQQLPDELSDDVVRHAARLKYAHAEGRSYGIAMETSWHRAAVNAAKQWLQENGGAR